MSDNRNHINQYSATDIQRYLDGRMNAAEMYALEKAALDDPFLADAIEGFELTKKEFDNVTINNDLDQLRNQIAEKASGGKVIPLSTFRWSRLVAAAVVVLIFGAVAYTYWLKPEKSKQLIVVNDNKPASSEANAAPADKAVAQENDTFNKNITRSLESAKEPIIETEKNSARQADKPANRDLVSAPPVAIKDNKEKISNLTKTDDAIASSAVKQEKSISKKDSIDSDLVIARSQKAVEDKEIQKKSANAEELIIVNPDKSKDKPVVTGYGTVKATTIPGNNTLNYFSGRVTDNNNLPVANATVQLFNTRNGYTTDQNGNFRIPSTDTSLKVTISGVGFNTQTTQLRNDLAINHIQLQTASASLSEVVITQPSANAKREKSNYKTKYPSVLIQDAEPANGWIEFDKYIESNKKVGPDDAGFKSGEVVVSFQVNRKSELSDFKIEQRLSVAQDAEAIRLIKEGPSWRLLKGKKTRIMVIIRF